MNLIREGKYTKKTTENAKLSNNAREIENISTVINVELPGI